MGAHAGGTNQSIEMKKRLACGATVLRSVRLRFAELRQIGIEKTEGVRGFDDANTSGALLFNDLIAEGLHPSPMNFWPEMMFGVITVKEPKPVIKLLVTAHAPGDRFVRIRAVMEVVTVQIREAMTQVPEAREKKNVVPV